MTQAAEYGGWKKMSVLWRFTEKTSVFSLNAGKHGPKKFR